MSTIRIRPSGGWAALRLRELWEFRELLYFLVWRDVRIRYKQTALGAAWALLQPTLTMVVFALFFGRLGGLPSDGVPYPLFAYTALVPWGFFANGLTQSSQSVVNNAALVRKVFFPRLIIPIAAVLSGIVDLGIATVLLVVLMIGYGVHPTPRMAILPVFALLALACALAFGLWLAALNARYRDVRYTVPFLVQLWMFVTPVAYPSSLVPEAWRVVYGLNPMAGVVEGFRWCLLGIEGQPIEVIATSTAATTVLLVTGAMYFQKTERTFADVI